MEHFAELEFKEGLRNQQACEAKLVECLRNNEQPTSTAWHRNSQALSLEQSPSLFDEGGRRRQNESSTLSVNHAYCGETLTLAGLDLEGGEGKLHHYLPLRALENTR